MQKLLFTYILLCNDDSYYVGVTNDVVSRTLQHNSDNNPGSYCHSRRPVQLVFMRTFKNPDEAIAFEKQLKGWSKRKKTALIFGDFKLLHKLAECQNKSHFKNRN